MIKAIIFDFSRVILHPLDQNYIGGLNELHRNLKNNRDYSPIKHFYLNQELLDYLAQMKNKYLLFILTKGYLQNEPEFKPSLDSIFKQIFSSEQLGVSKEDSSTFKKLAEEIQAKPEEILFIDDSLKNIEAAKQSSFKTVHYLGNDQLFKELKNLGI